LVYSLLLLYLMNSRIAIFRNHNNRYAYNLEELGRYYLAYHKLMDYWYSILPEFIYPLRYEELITNQEEES